MMIYVRQEHIDRGIPGKCRHCPVALAIKETTGARIVEVAWSIDVDSRPFNMPHSVTEFVGAFDRGQPVAPFAFELPLEDASHA